MANKMSKLLQEHNEFIYGKKAVSVDVVETSTDVSIITPEVPALYETPFKIPEDKGQSAEELVNESASSLLLGAMTVAKRAFEGKVDPLKEGNFPHKMALQLVGKAIPARKWGAKPPDKTPEDLKRKARQLNSLIAKLSIDGEAREAQVKSDYDPSKRVRYDSNGQVIRE